MNRIYLNIILLFVSSCAFAQTKEINGIVYSYPDDKNIVVGISIIHNKHSETPNATTNDDGYFRLTIPSKTISPTQITIDSTGRFNNYKIVNEYTTNNVSTTSKDPIKVYVGNKQSIDEQRIKFYKINADRIDKKYDEQIRQLQYSNANYKQIIDSLNKERIADKAIINRLSEQVQELQFELHLLKNDPNALADNLIKIHSDEYNISLEHFWKGEYDDAKNHMISKDLLRKHELMSEIVFNRAKLNALIYTAMGDYANAIDWYNEIINHATLNFKKGAMPFFLIYTDKAELELRLKQYSAAENDIEEALRIDVNIIYKVRANNLLGNILKEKGEANEYAEKYQQAITLYKEKKKEIGDICVPIADREAAISCTMLADYYNEKGKSRQAENNYKAALNIYIEMWKNKEYDNVNYLNLLVKMATFYTEERKTSLVKQCNDRISILMSNTNNFSKEDKAKTNEWLGYLDLKNKKYDEALDKYISSFKFYTEMDKQTPLIYKDGLIRTAFMAGVVCNYNKDYQRSIQYCKLALNNIDDNLAIMEYQKMQGYVLALLSNNYKKTKDNTQAESCMAKANNIAKKINDSNLTKYVQYIKLEKIHNTINFLMDWVLPYIGMLPYIIFVGATII
jgi:tetratricopeptide (TPR) repeat protein